MSSIQPPEILEQVRRQEHCADVRRKPQKKLCPKIHFIGIREKLTRLTTIIFLSFRTDRSGQTVQTQISADPDQTARAV